jgi:ribosomal protein S18 acetylase RimI-like enzyme
MEKLSYSLSEVEIVELTNDLVQQASKLLAGYIHPSGTTINEINECIRSLNRLIESNNAQLFLAQCEDDFVGFVSINWGFSTTKGTSYLRIQDLYTVPEYRKKRIANTLLKYCEDLAQYKGARSLRLETDTDNFRARNLYEKLGYEYYPRKEVYMKFLE